MYPCLPSFSLLSPFSVIGGTVSIGTWCGTWACVYLCVCRKGSFAFSTTGYMSFRSPEETALWAALKNVEYVCVSQPTWIGGRYTPYTAQKTVHMHMYVSVKVVLCKTVCTTAHACVYLFPYMSIFCNLAVRRARTILNPQTAEFRFLLCACQVTRLFDLPIYLASKVTLITSILAAWECHSLFLVSIHKGKQR